MAILMVLLFHFMPDVVMPNRALEWAKKFGQAGWLGVDLFFVLSGFLITRLLLQAKGQPGYFKNFYARRSLRIFPLYFAALALIFLVWPQFWTVSQTNSASEVVANQWWSWCYLTNVGMFLLGKEAFASPEITVTHFWSLAVEEQFYLLWPLLIFFTPRRWVPLACFGCVVLAPVLRSLAFLSWDLNLYFSLQMPCRIDALACGGLLACVDTSRLKNSYLLFTGFVCSLILGLVMYREKGLWPGSNTMQTVGITIAVIGLTCAIALACRLPTGSKWYRALARGPLPFFGKYSYGIYVIHGLTQHPLDKFISSQSLISATHSIPLGAAIYICLQTAVATLLALVTWFLIEKRFLSLKRYFE